ncbi:MAG: ribonuclease III [Cyanobacteria bacterium P01_H01_bin.74]
MTSLDNARKKQIRDLLQSLGLTRPKNYALYDTALTHSSYTHENKLASVENYERLEYLGDAVLKLSISEILFMQFPDYREGELTKIRAVVVSDARLAIIAKTIALGDCIVFGASEARSGGKNKSSNLACAFEALLGALFLDGKLDQVRTLLPQLFESLIAEVDASKTKSNYKAVLQELTQADEGVLPYYKTVKETGPSHNRTFKIEVAIHGEVMGIGSGKSKKEAQQLAAKMALMSLDALDDEEQTAF